MAKRKSNAEDNKGTFSDSGNKIQIPDKFNEELRKLLDGFKIPSELAAFRGASRHVMRIIESESRVAENSNDEHLFKLSIALSENTLPGYATLDITHIEEINNLIEEIKKYSSDSSRKKPLNFLMLAEPGAGKSHFVDCLVKMLGEKKFGAVTYNMVGIQRHEDLGFPLENIRNLKVVDRLPVLFLDEFDANQDIVPLLLPLLWDGEFSYGQHAVKLGKVVIVLAGSHPRLDEIIKKARDMQGESQKPRREKLNISHSGFHPKIQDLLSRINGGTIHIPPFSKRPIDKVCIAISLLNHRFDGTLKLVPSALLRFIEETEFRYGSRSISHLIGLIPKKIGDASELTLGNLDLPIDNKKLLEKSSLAFHLTHKKSAVGIVNLWNELKAKNIQIPMVRASEVIDAIMLFKVKDFLSSALPSFVNFFTSGSSKG